MATLVTQTTVTIVDAAAQVASNDFTLQAANTGTTAVRELAHPTGLLATLQYCKNPDKWTNFDSAPITARPTVAVLATLADNKLTTWKGVAGDVGVQEIWKGSEREGAMTLTMFRHLLAFYENPPDTGFVQWSPKDRTNDVYNIVIQSLTVGGQQMTFDFLAHRNDLVVGDVVFSFRIVSKV